MPRLTRNSSLATRGRNALPDRVVLSTRPSPFVTMHPGSSRGGSRLLTERMTTLFGFTEAAVTWLGSVSVIVQGQPS